MEPLLAASSSTAAALMSSGHFLVPKFQREYAWELDDVDEFFGDLSKALAEDTYFLGLVILTGDSQPKDVVDGQQRLLTLTLLTAALCREAERFERRALAEWMKSTFLKFVDFNTDAERPRLKLSSEKDDRTLQGILEGTLQSAALLEDKTVSGHLRNAYGRLSNLVQQDLGDDPFKRLGLWADFLNTKLYFASFVHPSPASAYKVFEVINTRGKALTTADLLKSWVLSNTSESHVDARYREWQALAEPFEDDGSGSFVQFIRHAVTTVRGHVPPKDLYEVLAGGGDRGNMSPGDLIELLQDSQAIYLQMLDQTVEGPADEKELSVFSVLNTLKIVSVRPILMAMAGQPDSAEGMKTVLRLVVRRVVTGNLGTGNVERRFSQAARKIRQDGRWEEAIAALGDLDKDREAFQRQVLEKSMNKDLLAVIRRSVINDSITPDPVGELFLIKPRFAEWSALDKDRATFWVSTIGNSFLANVERRPSGSSSWVGFKAELLDRGVKGEWTDELRGYDDWNIEAIKSVGEQFAARATELWYAS